jgi:hypothetical protein
LKKDEKPLAADPNSYQANHITNVRGGSMAAMQKNSFANNIREERASTGKGQIMNKKVRRMPGDASKPC